MKLSSRFTFLIPRASPGSPAHSVTALTRRAALVAASISVTLLVGASLADPPQGGQAGPQSAIPKPTPEQQRVIDTMTGAMQQNMMRQPTPEEQQKIDDLGGEMRQGMATGPAGTEFQRRYKEEHDAVAKLMGYQPGEGVLYVFVSHSMSDALIESYLREAMWANAALVVRGIPEGMKMGQYIREKMYPMMRYTSLLGSFTIDPPLFDMYAVDKTPTIVWDTDVAMSKSCHKTQRSAKGPSGRVVQYRPCEPVDPSTYWKVSGAVSIDWALEQFAAAGAPGAQNRLDGMRKRLGMGQKDQLPYKGDFANVLSPDVVKQLKDTEDKIQQERRMEEGMLAPVVEPVPR